MLTKKQEEKIRSLWENPEFHGSFTGLTNFMRALHSENINVSKREVTQILYSIPAYIDRVHRLKLTEHRPYRVVSTNKYWECDIALMPVYDGYIGFLLCVDLYSRKVFTHLLKSKTFPEQKQAFLQMFQENFGKRPSTMQGDGEYDKNVFKTFFQEEHIRFRACLRRNKCVIAELNNYKIKKRLHAYISHTKDKNWPSKLKLFTENENDTPKPIIGGLKPSQIHSDADDHLIREAAPNRPRLIPWRERFRNQSNYEKNKDNGLQVGDLCLYDLKNKHWWEKSWYVKVSFFIDFNSQSFVPKNK